MLLYTVSVCLWIDAGAPFNFLCIVSVDAYESFSIQSLRNIMYFISLLREYSSTMKQ